MVFLYMEFRSFFFFGDFKNAVFVRSVKMQKKTSVVFFFPQSFQSTGHHVLLNSAELWDGGSD